MAKPEEKNSIGLTVKKEDDLSEWYQQVILKSEMADYTRVSGCIVYLPRSYAVWEKIQEHFNKRIKSIGVKNAYFPMFIPESLLTKESEHVEGFTPEVAWVTHAGETKLNERLAVRPTSETIMYDSYSRWIRSYKDLPFQLNQWCSVVRWEFKHPMIFIRGREFLWQEGHTVHETKESADKEVRQILDFYAEVCEKLLAFPVMQGQKSESEKFAGALYTTSIEAVAPNGKAIQAGTSHCLGQNFAKAFDIQFMGRDDAKHLAWQNSWGITTRLIGTMIMIHSDDKGLVLPPKVAPVHAVIVPIIFEKDKEAVLAKARELKEKLSDEFEITLDDRDDYTAGWKFNEWELKGIPVRIELGPKDLKQEQAVLVRRDTGKKEFVKLDQIGSRLKGLLEDIQDSLLRAAKEKLSAQTAVPKNFEEAIKAIEDKKIIKVYYCGTRLCEDWIKDKTGGAKSLNMPFDQPNMDGKHCIYCNEPAKHLMFFGKSY